MPRKYAKETAALPLPEPAAETMKKVADREAAQAEKEPNDTPPWRPSRGRSSDPTPTVETPEPTPEPETTTETAPDTSDDETASEQEPEPGPLSKLQTAVRELLDYDQIGEIRLALYSRETELEKHAKKGSDLGVREEDARRRLHVIRGDSLRFGLTRIFAPEEVTEQRDVFFDREKANGRPDAEVDDLVHDHVRGIEEQEADAAALAAEVGAATEEPAGVGA